jgi:hypothetical protein
MHAVSIHDLHETVIAASLHGIHDLLQNVCQTAIVRNLLSVRRSKFFRDRQIMQNAIRKLVQIDQAIQFRLSMMSDRRFNGLRDFVGFV